MKSALKLFLISITFLFAWFLNAHAQDMEKNIEMYETTWDKIINKGQIQEINDKNFDPEVVLITSPENIVGIKGFKNYYQNYLRGFSDITFNIISVFGQGDDIVKHWRFKGTHTGNFFGIPATGNTVDVEGVTLVKMKNGKILQEQDFMDNMVFQQQLGLVSDPENMSTIDSVYKAFGKGDIATVLAAMSPNIEWNEAEGNSYADGNPYIGPDAVLNGVFARLGTDYEYFRLKDIHLHEMSNNQVLATLRYDGKLKKSGANIDTQAAHLWTLKDGKIVTFQQYVDTKQLADAENK